MSNYKFNSFGFNFDELGKAVDDFVNNIKVNDIFGTDSTKTIPPVNSLEYPDYLELQVAAPGLAKEDFDLHIEEDILTISANAIVKNASEEIKIKRKEFNYSTFKRTFCLTDKFDYQNITAKYEAGVLLVTIPKKTEEEKSKIKVQVL
ncbi:MULTISPECIES: Hsp20/alpha crystallin family protein [unclassified Aureispira]|uniref:Hsp20/alpha crystallin family protein n=1 Tax=unclassified Aureispira TaxID=2649989 RepID=UPI00069819DE|nr:MULTISPECIES: Hsp20/alpha crystallin family protein [unclassified Aureispira]WMX15547.1 Hsp20/alpha crystallin family protein [Aureispira sp. CCB-E]